MISAWIIKETVQEIARAEASLWRVTMSLAEVFITESQKPFGALVL